MTALRPLPRRLHAGAWWLWALGLAAAATMTTNPFLLGLVVAVAALVVSARRTSDPWARGFGAYMILGLVVIGIRVVFRILLGGGLGDHLLFTILVLPLPDWFTGVTIGGPVMVESVLASLYGGLRLAAIVVAVGAANALADPRRLLASLPRSLYDIGAALVVALSLAPHLIESVGRVRRARRLRGTHGGGLRSLRSILVPVLEEAMERSISLAASMDSRGYGRTVAVPRWRRRWTGAFILAGLGSMCVGMFWILGGTSTLLGGCFLIGGLAMAVIGLAASGRLVERTRYRPDAWEGQEWLVAGTGLVAALGMAAAGVVAPADLAPSVQPLAWPGFSLPATLALLVATVPALAAPAPGASVPAVPECPPPQVRAPESTEEVGS